MPKRRKRACQLCGANSLLMGYSMWDGKRICDACYIKESGKLEEAMAKKKAGNNEKGKDTLGRNMAKVSPCTKCGRMDFKTDQARRGHQGKCPGKSTSPDKLATSLAGKDSIVPCEKCGKTGFESKRHLGQHQRRCPGKNPPPVLVKPKSVPVKAKVSPELAKALAGPPPELDTSVRAVLQKAVEEGKAEEGKKKRTPSQISRGSKQKGNKFENEVKKILAKWWGEPADVVGSKNSAFQRAPGSGGTSPKNWPLDLFVPEAFPWAVECKNREGDAGMDTMERFFTGKYPVVEWFKTAEEELVAAGCKKPLLLVFTRNQFPIFVAFRRPVAGESHMMISERHTTLCDQPFGELVIQLLDDFIKFPPGVWGDIYNQSLVSAVEPRKWA